MSDRRHPAEVTADRLKDSYEKWNSRWEPEELDFLSIIIDKLERFAAEDKTNER